MFGRSVGFNVEAVWAKGGDRFGRMLQVGYGPKTWVV